MSTTYELLEQLRDVREPLPPEGVSVWLIVANLTLVLGIVALLLYRRHQQKNHWRLQVLTDIRHLHALEPDEAISQAATVLRQLILYRGEQVQALSGEQWLQALDSHFDTQWFSRGDGKVFGESLYQRNTTSQIQLDRLLVQLEALVKSLPRHPQVQPATAR